MEWARPLAKWEEDEKNPDKDWVEIASSPLHRWFRNRFLRPYACHYFLPGTRKRNITYSSILHNIIDDQGEHTATGFRMNFHRRRGDGEHAPNGDQQQISEEPDHVRHRSRDGGNTGLTVADVGLRGKSA
jgi:hypothetical protein